MLDRNLSSNLTRILKASLNSTKTCYILNCDKPCIKAHSVSNSRYLKKISTNGEVLFMSAADSGHKGSLVLIRTGKGKATTFPGFCDKHDKYFKSIDDSDYIIGNDEQNFLFAFRAAACEFTKRQSTAKMLKDVTDDKYPELDISAQGKEYLKAYLISYSVGTKDISVVRVIMNINFSKQRYWKLKSEVIVLDKEYPIVASSTFKLEEDIEGNIINNITDLESSSRPLFFTLIPQNGKTYCIMSWHKKDNYFYRNLCGLNSLENEEKKVIISNLLTSYVENLAVNQGYWNSLPNETIEKFNEQWGISIRDLKIPFIYNKKLSLFV